MRGFVRESLGIAAWAGAAYVSFIGIDYVRLPVRDLVGNPEMAEIVGYAVLFLVAWHVATYLSVRALKPGSR